MYFLITQFEHGLELITINGTLRTVMNKGMQIINEYSVYQDSPFGLWKNLIWRVLICDLVHLSHSQRSVWLDLAATSDDLWRKLGMSVSLLCGQLLGISTEKRFVYYLEQETYRALSKNVWKFDYFSPKPCSKVSIIFYLWLLTKTVRWELNKKL